MSSIVADLLELMPDTVTVQPGTTDFVGQFAASGSALSLRCRIEGGPMMIQDERGKEVVSMLRLYIGSTENLTVDGHRFTLPADEGFAPRSLLQALRIESARDETDAHHRVVHLP